MTASSTQFGHCRCGSVRLTIHAMPDFSVYCHCDDCRRATGAPVLASIGVLKSDVSWQAKESLQRHTIGTASRLFCNRCGSPVGQEHESRADMLFINTCFMDNPAAFPPKAHTFVGQQLDWLKLDDTLQRVEKTLLIQTDQTQETVL